MSSYLVTDLRIRRHRQRPGQWPPCCSRAASRWCSASTRCDTIGDVPPEYYEFYNLGLGDPYSRFLGPWSWHRRPAGRLLRAHRLREPGEEYDEEYIKVAVIGKPNVGKSSLRQPHDRAGAGHCIQYCRHHPGRHRQQSWKTSTASMCSSTPPASAARSRVEDDDRDVTASCGPIWRWTGRMSAVIVIDATEGFTEQDSKVAGYAHEQGKASVVVSQQVGCRGKGRQDHGRVPQEAGE